MQIKIIGDQVISYTELHKLQLWIVTLTYIDNSVIIRNITFMIYFNIRPCSIYLMAISQETLKIFMLDMSLEMINSKWQVYLPGATELKIIQLPLRWKWK